ncbi:MAG: HAD family hydrolase [Candidatus Levybacteria bacterium]|nr:HAD family hydrolase [Candidatus Levybacteria bacterium]
MIKLVVFDWNGTLIADTLTCMAAYNHVLDIFGGKEVNLKAFRSTMVFPVIDFYIKHGCKRKELLQSSKKLGEIFHTYYESSVLKLRTRKNTKKLLEWLYQHNIELIILSNHTEEGIKSQLQRLRIKKYFSIVLANIALDSFMKLRNKKEKLEHYLEQHKLKTSEVIIIGDSKEELEMGKHIGVKTVAITNGFSTVSQLKRANPDYLIDNLKQLITFVEKTN